MGKIKVLIGRGSQCDYTIENPEQHGTVSGAHATISETDNPNQFLFEDHSRNGSYINGHLLHNDRCLINANDNITLSRTYVLPLTDILQNYFSSRKTIKRESRQTQIHNFEPEQTRKWNPMATGDPKPSDDSTIRWQKETKEPTVITEIPEKIEKAGKEEKKEDKSSSASVIVSVLVFFAIIIRLIILLIKL